jgi:hypothetical protein
MLLVKTNNGQVEKYPYTIGLLRKENPMTPIAKNPSLEFLAGMNVYPVKEANPMATATQKVEKVWTPTLVGSDWVLPHKLVDKTAEDLAADMDVLKLSIEEATEKRLEDAAKGRGYKSLDRLLNYTNSTNEKWATEAIYMQTLQTQTWEALLSILAAVNAGTREAPASYEEIEPELPVIDWPE